MFWLQQQRKSDLVHLQLHELISVSISHSAGEGDDHVHEQMFAEIIQKRNIAW